MSFPIHTSCDAAGAKAETSHHTPRHPKLVLATTILASGLAFIDGSVVNVGLPAISVTFHAGAEDLKWVANAYLLSLSALLLLGGGAGDRFGRVRLLVVGPLLFGVASAACAVAPSLPWLLVLARGLQGIGAALLMPNSLAILGSSFSAEARGRAIGIWASMGAVMGVIRRGRFPRRNTLAFDQSGAGPRAPSACPLASVRGRIRLSAHGFGHREHKDNQSNRGGGRPSIMILVKIERRPPKLHRPLL